MPILVFGDMLMGSCPMVQWYAHSIGQRKINVVLLGNGAGPINLVEFYTKAKCKTAQERGHAFCLVSTGPDKTVHKGEAGLQQLCDVLSGQQSEALRAIKGMEESVFAEHVESDQRDSVLVNFIIAPEIRGLRGLGEGGKPSDWKSAVVLDISLQLQSRRAETEKLFKEKDGNKDRLLSQKDLHKVLTSLDVGLQHEKVQELFRAIDLDGDGQIDYEDFLAAFAPDFPSPSPASAAAASGGGGGGGLSSAAVKKIALDDVEGALNCVCESADVIIVLVEATKARVSMRELDVYQSLHKQMRSKVRGLG